MTDRGRGVLGIAVAGVLAAFVGLAVFVFVGFLWSTSEIKTALVVPTPLLFVPK